MDKIRLIELALTEAFMPADARDVGDFLRHEEEARQAGEPQAGHPQGAPFARPRARYADSLLSRMSAVRALDHGAGL